jgi:hypothetical protein
MEVRRLRPDELDLLRDVRRRLARGRRTRTFSLPLRPPFHVRRGSRSRSVIARGGPGNVNGGH